MPRLRKKHASTNIPIRRESTCEGVGAVVVEVIIADIELVKEDPTGHSQLRVIDS
jgi:hypothetical protein